MMGTPSEETCDLQRGTGKRTRTLLPQTPDGPRLTVAVTDPTAERAPKSGKQPRRWLPVVLAEPPAPTLSAPQSAVEFNDERLRRLYGLTRTEARFAELLACGLGLSSASQRLGISYQTGKSHLKRIYLKTRAHQQYELVALLLSGPAQLQVNYCGRDDVEDVDVDAAGCGVAARDVTR